MELYQELPGDMPKLGGVVCTANDLGGDMVTCCSCMGYFIFLNSTPIHWFWKKQGGIETTTFDTEFVVMKQVMEYICRFPYKLMILGILVEGPPSIYSDNQSVLANTT